MKTYKWIRVIKIGIDILSLRTYFKISKTLGSGEWFAHSDFGLKNRFYCFCDGSI